MASRSRDIGGAHSTLAVSLRRAVRRDSDVLPPTCPSRRNHREMQPELVLCRYAQVKFDDKIFDHGVQKLSP